MVPVRALRWRSARIRTARRSPQSTMLASSPHPLPPTNPQRGPFILVTAHCLVATINCACVSRAPGLGSCSYRNELPHLAPARANQFFSPSIRSTRWPDAHNPPTTRPQPAHNLSTPHPPSTLHPAGAQASALRDRMEAGFYRQGSVAAVSEPRCGEHPRC